MKKIYIMLSKTNTVFCSLIQTYTKEPYAHVSLLFSDDYLFGYSFSRKKVNNPFFGGLMKEDYFKWVAAFPETECLMYELTVSSQQYASLYSLTQSFYAEKEKYKYHLLGVIGHLFNIKISMENRYFCSQFVATLLGQTGILSFDKDPLFITAADFKAKPELTLIYEGNLMELLHSIHHTYKEPMAAS
ncbi:MAG: hypothetical protein ACRCTE_06640 [Cellulosilyticaceae bacterium]